jgi:hypothetical protein
MTYQSREHWFDRVAGAPTRRQALKMALGTAAALVFPLTQSEPADGDSGGTVPRDACGPPIRKLRARSRYAGSPLSPRS